MSTGICNRLKFSKVNTKVQLFNKFYEESGKIVPRLGYRTCPQVANTIHSAMGRTSRLRTRNQEWMLLTSQTGLFNLTTAWCLSSHSSLVHMFLSSLDHINLWLTNTASNDPYGPWHNHLDNWLGTWDYVRTYPYSRYSRGWKAEQYQTRFPLTFVASYSPY